MALELGGEVIAEIAIEGMNYPWTYGRILDSRKFERFRVYFSQSWPENDPAFSKLRSEVEAKGDFRLRSLATNRRFTVFLNQDGDIVWFRHHPESEP
jgi:hypothetical protein